MRCEKIIDINDLLPAAIPEGKFEVDFIDTRGVKLLERSVLLEKLTFDQLFRASEPKRILRSKTVRGPALDVSSGQDSMYYFFNYKSFPSTTGLRHKGYVRFLRPKGIMPTLNRWLGRDPDKKPLEKVYCMVDCSCPDFRYTWAWVAKQKGASKVGSGSLNQAWNQAPKIKNPEGKIGLCKHLLAVRDYIYGQVSSFKASDEKAVLDRIDKMTKQATQRWINLPAEMAKAKERERQIARSRQVRMQGKREPVGSPPPSFPTPTPGDVEKVRDQNTPDPDAPKSPDLEGDFPPEEPQSRSSVVGRKRPSREKNQSPNPDTNNPSESVVSKTEPMNIKPLQEAIGDLDELTASQGPEQPDTSALDQDTDALTSLHQIRDLLQQLVDVETAENEGLPGEEENGDLDIPVQGDEEAGGGELDLPDDFGGEEGPEGGDEEGSEDEEEKDEDEEDDKPFGK